MTVASPPPAPGRVAIGFSMTLGWGGHGQEVTMRKLLIGLLILGGVIAAIAFIKRRSGSGVAEWDSFAAGDSYAQTSKDAAAKATDAAKDAAAKATDAAKDAAAKATDAAKGAPTTATKAAKDAATKATDAAKDAPTTATKAAKDAAAKATDAAKDA